MHKRIITYNKKQGVYFMKKQKDSAQDKTKFKKLGAAVFGTVCSAVMLVGGASLMTGCNNTNPDDLRGKSAYDLYCENVPEGQTPMTLQEWLDSLRGPRGFQGENSYDIAIRTGFFEGTEEEWLASLQATRIVGIKYCEDETGAYLNVTLSDNNVIVVYINRVVASQQDFIAALADDSITTITVSNDITLTQDVDFGGKTIAVEGTLTLDGGTSATPTNINLSNASIGLDGGELVISNANLVVDSGKSLEIIGNGGDISIDDGCSLVVKNGAAMTIEGATITSDIAVQADASANVEINNCVINGDFSIATTPAAANNQANTSSKINNTMMLSPDDSNTPTAGLLPEILLDRVSFNGDVTISSDLDVTLNGCFIDSSKTMTVTKGNVVLTEGSFRLLPYLTLSPAQGTTASVDIYVEDATGLNAAMAYNSEFKTIYLAEDIVPTDAVQIDSAQTIYGQGHKLKANVSGSGTIVFNNIYTTNIEVAGDGGFSGTLVFNGGYLDTDKPGSGDDAAAFYSGNNPDASFEFKNMAITANITKGIKISNAKSVVIDNCEFDATKLAIMQDALNSSAQSLSLVDIQIYNGTTPTDVTITNCYFEGSIQGKTVVPTIVDSSGVLADSDTGAAIKLKVEKGMSFGTVVISGNTFKDNYRDVLVGTGPYANQLQMSAATASGGRSADGLQNNKIDDWTIENNTTTITAAIAAARGVATLSYINGGIPGFDKYTTYVGNVGEVVGGCGIWTIGNAFEKVNDTWYYKEGGKLYTVTVEDGIAILTEFDNN